MAGINQVIVVGNVGRDPETRFAPGGAPVCNFSVATSESWTDKATGEKQEATEWHNIVCWNRTAEIVQQYVTKGRQVAVLGKLKTRDWTDPQGVKHYKTEIIASHVELLGKRDDSQQRNAAPAREHYTGMDDFGPPLDLDAPELSPGRAF